MIFEKDHRSHLLNFSNITETSEGLQHAARAICDFRPATAKVEAKVPVGPRELDRRSMANPDREHSLMH